MDDSSDADLLAAWCTGDQEAFAVLVARHHGMVRVACARQAGPGDVEDCVQAVFLVLSRRASAATRSPSLAAWLHRVAGFVCRHARRSAQRRRRAEQAAAAVVVAQAAGRPPEALGHLDDCLQRLPEKQRTAVVLHFLAGKDVQEVAVSLGTSSNNASQLISRGLAALRTLLARRGIAMGSVALTSLLAGEAQAAATPATTAMIATLTAAAPSSAASTLATGAMTSMTIATITPLSIAAGLLLAVGTTTVLLAAEPAPVAPRNPPPETAAPAPAVAKDASPSAANPTRADLSGSWNSADSGVVAAELARKILTDPWLDRYIQIKKQSPKLVVGRLVVRTEGEIINTELLIDKVQRQLLASGKIVFVEPVEIAAPASDGTKAHGAGDVVLNGSVSLEKSEQGTAKVRLYTVTLKGTDIAASQLLFSVEAQVRKEIVSTSPGAPARF